MTTRRAGATVVAFTAAVLLASCSVSRPGTVSAPTLPAMPTETIAPLPAMPTETIAPLPAMPTETIAPPPATTAQASAAAVTTADVYTATRDAVLLIQAQDGSGRALTELGRLARARADVSGLCHAISHDLGHAALELANGRVGDALTDRDDVCGGGFTHGVIEHALAASDDPARDMLTVCAPQQDGSCWHGVGHGLMFAEGMDASRALAGCDEAPTSVLSNRCGEGVFMQLFSADLAAGHAAGAGMAGRAIARDPTASLEMCRTTRSRYDAQCWFYAPVVWLTVHPDDFAGGIDWCRGAGSGFPAAQCARGLGSRSVKFHPDDLSIGARACGAAGELLDACVNGMGSYWSVHWEGAVPPRDICGHLPPGKARKRCPSVTS